MRIMPCRGNHILLTNPSIITNFPFLKKFCFDLIIMRKLLFNPNYKNMYYIKIKTLSNKKTSHYIYETLKRSESPLRNTVKNKKLRQV